MSSGSEPGLLWKGASPPIVGGQGDVWINQTTNEVQVHNGLRFAPLVFTSGITGPSFKVLPSGSGTLSESVVHNTSDSANAGALSLRMNGATASLTTSAAGTGTEPSALVFASSLGNLGLFATATGGLTLLYPLGVTVTTTNDSLQFRNDDSGSLGVLIGCLHNSQSPAVNDVVLRISGRGNNSSLVNTSYGYMSVYISDPTAGTTDAYFLFTIQLAGTATDTLLIDPANGSIFYVGGLEVRAGGLKVTAGHIGVGGAQAANFGVWLQDNVVSDGSVGGYGFSTRNAIITAGVNSDSLAGLAIQHTFALASKTSVSCYGIDVTPTWVAAGTNYGVRISAVTGAAATNYGLYIAAPTGASLNEAIHVHGGDVTLAGAALATNATTGFLNIPTCAGAPTGAYTPPTGTVALVYDTTNHFLYVREGGTWKKSTVYA